MNRITLTLLNNLHEKPTRKKKKELTVPRITGNSIHQFAIIRFQKETANVNISW